jgi:cytochrome d ubiquinol oxidase subunit II
MGVLLIGFALTDGFDLGVAALLPFVARTDERTPDGDQLHRVRPGKATKSGSSLAAARSSRHGRSSMRSASPASIWRCSSCWRRSSCGPSVSNTARRSPIAAWRARWDWALFVGGFVPALVFGVAVGNVLTGIPFRLDSDLRSFYEGSLLGLFHPFSLVAGLLSVAMIVLHGASWLAIKIERGAVHDRARAFGQVAAVASILLFAIGGVMVATMGYGFRLTHGADPLGPSNPLLSGTVAAPGAWLDNYGAHPWMLIAPILGFAGPLLAWIGIRKGREVLAFGGSSLGAIGIIATVGLSMFPFILPSSIDPASSLTVWNASSSHVTLFIMLAVTVIFLPIVLLYTAWVYKVLFGRITLRDVDTNPDFY